MNKLAAIMIVGALLGCQVDLRAVNMEVQEDNGKKIFVVPQVHGKPMVPGDTHYCVRNDNNYAPINCNLKCHNHGGWTGKSEITADGVRCICVLPMPPCQPGDANEDKCSGVISCGKVGWKRQVVVVAPHGQDNVIADAPAQ